MEKIQVFITLATSVITFITLIYNIVIKKGNNRERQYYEKILQPFIAKWSVNKQISAIDTIKGLVTSEDEDIPKYISYLISKEDEDDADEKLKKVLCYDYTDIYPNDFSSIGKILNSFSKIMYYIMFLIALIFMFLMAIPTSIFVGNIILACYDFIMNGGQFVDIINMIFSQCEYLLVIGVLFGTSIILMKLANRVNIDRYSLSKKRIEAMIKKKVAKYDNNGNDYVI